MWHLTHGTWHVTPDTWHLSCDMWYMVGDEYSLKFQLPSSYDMFCFFVHFVTRTTNIHIPFELTWCLFKCAKTKPKVYKNEDRQWLSKSSLVRRLQVQTLPLPGSANFTFQEIDLTCSIFSRILFKSKALVLLTTKTSNWVEAITYVVKMLCQELNQMNIFLYRPTKTWPSRLPLDSALQDQK